MIIELFSILAQYFELIIYMKRRFNISKLLAILSPYAITCLPMRICTIKNHKQKPLKYQASKGLCTSNEISI